jgi:hypothetical protein
MRYMPCLKMDKFSFELEAVEENSVSWPWMAR